MDLIRFNPTLVRLRLPRHHPLLCPSISFQSHAGSIEASASPGSSFAGSSVSIPRWFD